MTIFDIEKEAYQAYAQAFTPSNIIAAFAVAGTEPSNSNIFTDDEYLALLVTDHLEPEMTVNYHKMP